MTDATEVRKRCANAIKNTATGRHLGKALDDLEMMLRRCNYLEAAIETLSFHSGHIHVKYGSEWLILRDWAEEVMRGHDLDLSPCLTCGEPIFCIPDGLPICRSCAEKEAMEQ